MCEYTNQKGEERLTHMYFVSKCTSKRKLILHHTALFEAGQISKTK